MMKDTTKAAAVGADILFFEESPSTTRALPSYDGTRI